MASMALMQSKVSVASPWPDNLIIGTHPTENGFLVDLRGGTLAQL
jgi:hypothetical protein